MKQWTIIPPTLKAAYLLMLAIIPTFVALCSIRSKTESSVMLEWELISVKSIQISAPVIIDKITLMFSILVIVISFSVIIFSVSYISGEKNLIYFTWIVILFVTSINLLIYFPRLITLLLGWDGLGITSYLLVIYYANDKALAAGIITALSNRVGDALLILVCGWSIIIGHWNLILYPSSITYFIAFALIIAATTKRAQIPFSAWLPAAIAAPTPVSALVHSSTLVTAGIFLLIRFYPSLRQFFIFQIICFYLGTITCLIARLSARFENDFKKVIALSTLRQLGVIMISLGLNQPNLAFFHLLAHALLKSLLFIRAGTLIHNRTNNQDIRLMGNFYQNIPFTTTSINIANLSLCGTPFLAGFYSKDSIIETFLMSSIPLRTRCLIIIRVCLTSVYTIRLSILTLWTPFKGTRILITTDKRLIRNYALWIISILTVVGGARLHWLLPNTLITPIIPKIIKTITFITIVILAAAIILFIKNNMYFPSQANSSIWFLRLISASILNKETLSVSKTLIYNEITWIEKLRGKGISTILNKNLKIAQLTTNISTEKLLSIVGFLIIIVVIRLCY